MSVATKLEYLNDTKQLLKENINNLGGNLTTEPFRQYASVLEGIYERIPKISGIGASLSLSPSLMGKIKLNEIQGNTLQNGTPTPSSPVPIQNVTGLQNVEVCDKNLLDTSSFYKGYVNSSGVVTSDSVQALFDYVEVVPGGTYTISSQGTVASLNIVQYDANKNFISRTIQSDNPRTFTLGNTTYYIRIWTKVNDSTPMTQEIVNGLKLQFEKGSATTYEPYNGNTYEVNLGKNLFDKSVSPSSQNGTTTTELDTGIRATITSAGQNKYTAINLPNPSNLLGKTLTISATINISGTNTALIRFYWLNGNTLTSLIANSISTTGSGQITIPSSFPENTNGIAIVFSSNSGSSTSQVGDYVDYTNVQLELGETATSYSPYFTPIELNKIGNYEDSIKKSTGKNLFDKDNANVLNAYIDGSSGVITSDSPSRTIYIPCKPNTTYTISKIVSSRFRVSYSSSTPAIGTTTLGIVSDYTNTTITITTGANANYLVVWLYNSNSDTSITLQQVLDSIMINEGSTALPYEPYGKVWYTTENIGERTLNGSETWETQWNGDNIHGWRTTIPNLKQTTEGSQSSYVISDYYETRTQDENFSTGSYGISNRANQSQIIIKNNDILNQNDFKTWLGTHNVKVIYQLETPIYEVITNTELIEQLESLNNAKSKDGTTNINVTSEDLSMILNVGVLKGE